MGVKVKTEYINQIYAGWLAKIIGIRLGAPVEGWTFEQIRERYGRIAGYLVDYRDFAADDDSNGPAFFVRALREGGHFPDLQPQDVGDALMNYAGYEHGFFWFGGYGVSTEHTAFGNLWSGIPAPRSGSAKQNGLAVAEQIGGQIFIDCWGLVSPGNEERAARLARAAASVTHDGNGIQGGVFVAVCISHAFVERDIRRIIQKGLSFLPEDCEYAAVARAVMDFHDRHPEDWEACFSYIRDHWGYDRYPGNCHIIPNAAVMILSLLYGEGDFDRTLCICCMCGWDTDCNVGNVATIMGVRGGVLAIDYDRWRAPVNDFVVFSSVAGALNISGVPEGASYMAQLAYQLDGETPPEPWGQIWSRGRGFVHFAYPGSTQGIRVRGCERPILRNMDCGDATGGRALLVVTETERAGNICEVFKKTYYVPEDFYDDRYQPSFSPTVYPGQTVHCRLRPAEEEDRKKRDGEVLCKSRETGAPFEAKLYARVRKGQEEKILCSEAFSWEDGDFHTVSWQIPGKSSFTVLETGIRYQTSKTGAGIVLDTLYVDGEADYEIDFSRERTEKWTDVHREVSQFTREKGLSFLEDGRLHLSGADFAEAYTGDWDWTDYEAEFMLTPLLGEEHYALVRVQGALRSYAVGFTRAGRLGIRKKDRDSRILVEIPFEWKRDGTYRFRVNVEGNRIRVLYDGREILAVQDDKNPLLRGGIGIGVRENSHCSCSRIRLTCLKQGMADCHRKR